LKDSPLFVYEKSVSAAEKSITLGARKIITVWDGEVGVTYNKGKLVVLPPGRHIIEATEHVFQGFISTQQQCLHLSSPDSTKKQRSEEDQQILICETKDFVEIGLKADVFFKIADAEKVLLVLGKDHCDDFVRDTAVATLNSIIRSTTLGEVAQSKEMAAKSSKSEDPSKPATPLFFDKVHDEFISKLHDNFIDSYGIAITNIRIESFRIVNQELATNISQQAFMTAQTHNQLANLTGQTEIATVQQKRDAEVNRIKAEGDSVRLITEINAKNKAIMESAKAEADALVIKARSEAQSVELRAEAAAKAVIFKAEAEAKRAELLAKTPLGGQIQLYSMYADMVKSSMNGVKKVVYVPQVNGSGSDNNFGGPMSFLAFQTMMNNNQQATK